MTTTYPTRVMVTTTLINQIGQMNLLAISGGRIAYDNNNGVILPVSNGYIVRIVLAGNDTYRVTREYKRGTYTVKREWTNVYCDEIGEIAYLASCFRD